jgi:hypothetical protein
LRAGRVEQPGRDVAAGALAVPQDRPQRNDPGSAGDQQQRSAVAGVPHEPAADRAAQLELIAGAQFLGQVGRDLAVVEPFYGDRDRLAVGRCDRVGAFRGVAVLGGQPDVQMLPRLVARPVGYLELDRADRVRFPYH